MSQEKQTFAQQDKLPKLPIPDLEESCKKYLKSLEPLQTFEQHAASKAAVAEFLQNEGPKLQEELIEYAKTKHSYIEEFWDDSYLMGNDSVVLNLNPFFILEDEPDPARGTQLRRAANLTLATLAFIHDLRHETLPPDNFRGVPLDMFQYTRLFGMARIPSTNGCRLELHEWARHMVVVRRGRFYWFDVLDPNHCALFTESSLVATLRAIVRDADELGTKVSDEALGVLSTEKRRTWSIHRQTLERNSHNRECLKTIDSALFVLCLDDVAPQSASELANNMLCGTYALQDGVQTGTCLNRWYDKLQIIVCANGTAGVNFEHCSADGHTVLRFVADIYTELIFQFARSIHPQTGSLFQANASPYARGLSRKKGSAPLDQHLVQETLFCTTPRRLEWAWTDAVKYSVRYAEMRLSDLICQNESAVLEFDGYGKHFITSHGFSPDAFVQMAFQATYFSLYGRLAPTYEPAMTKSFLRGRTETIRTVQPEVLTFVQAWSDVKAPLQTKLSALRKACVQHTKCSKESASGHGFDRHFYALSCLWQLLHGAKDAPKPSLFADEGYDLLNHVVLSTSNCGNPALRIFGFGPVVQDGFGIGYIIHENRLTICASSKHLQTQRFLDTLRQYFYSIQRGLVEAFKSANVQPNQTYVDHAGNECDARTGLPISTLRRGPDELANGEAGHTGYAAPRRRGQDGVR
ncbi:carnitine O-acetyltransferase [Malassezia vespertilionis]|uniref:carnitine O-acetyltransferase n=1 Tax=Malassezia vespertilionis TaxID=2020962 RepID=UPI0024B1FC4D|nr:carnitine O-acetyltransferase [Malassezia vespertilionis]WFD07931.1 carnitine O-acetyltransferase [Malassezia vespertilionis]